MKTFLLAILFFSVQSAFAQKAVELDPRSYYRMTNESLGSNLSLSLYIEGGKRLLKLAETKQIPDNSGGLRPH
jgi:hypothetical protein